MKSFDGAVAVVTGAGSGIGAGIAHAVASRGASVVVADLDGQKAEGVAARLVEKFGPVATFADVDVSSPSSMEALAEETFDRFGVVHALFNNAGVSTVGAVWESSVDDWNFVLGVNLMGVVHGIQAFVPRMISSAVAGHVVNTSSMAGLIAAPLKAPYTASKHAVVGLSKVLRRDLEAVGAPIGVSVVCPGAVATPIIGTQLERYRNDPATSSESLKLLENLEASVSQGISGEQAGEVIVEGVLNESFWIWPNAEPHFHVFRDDVDEMGFI